MIAPLKARNRSQVVAEANKSKMMMLSLLAERDELLAKNHELLADKIVAGLASEQMGRELADLSRASDPVVLYVDESDEDQKRSLASIQRACGHLSTRGPTKDMPCHRVPKGHAGRHRYR